MFFLMPRVVRILLSFELSWLEVNFWPCRLDICQVVDIICRFYLYFSSFCNWIYLPLSNILYLATALPEKAVCVAPWCPERFPLNFGSPPPNLGPPNLTTLGTTKGKQHNTILWWNAYLSKIKDRQTDTMQNKFAILDIKFRFTCSQSDLY